MNKEEIECRYKLAVQADYCGSWQVPDYFGNFQFFNYWIIDTKKDTVVFSESSHSLEDTYESFIEKKLEEEEEEND